MAKLLQIKKYSKLVGAYGFQIPFQNRKKRIRREDGFTLVEAVIAMVILLIAVSGVFVTFTYAVNYNAGNNSRAQALTVLQQQVELMRSAKFTPSGTDSILQGGVKADQIVTSADGLSFRVQTKVDNDPSTPTTIEGESTVTTLKEITVTVTLNNPTPGWQTAVPAMVVLRRVQSN